MFSCWLQLCVCFAVCVHFLPNARKERKCWAIVEDILQLIKAHHLCQETGRTGWLIIKLLWVTITAPIQQHKFAKKRHTHTNEATSSRGKKIQKGVLERLLGNYVVLDQLQRVLASIFQLSETLKTAFLLWRWKHGLTHQCKPPL